MKNSHHTNQDEMFAFKKRIHLKYDYLLQQRGKLPKVQVDNSLFEGIILCSKKHSDVPYFYDFYKDYFLKYDIDSLIDLAYSLHGIQKKICKNLITASVLEYLANEEQGLHKDKSGYMIMELSDIYYNIRMNERLWFGDNETIKQYLKDHYADRILNATYPQKGNLIDRYKIRDIQEKSKNIDFNLAREKQIFCSLVISVYEELSNPISNKQTDMWGQLSDVEKPEIEDVHNTQTDQSSTGNTDNVQKSNTPQKAKALSSQAHTGTTLIHNTTNIEALDSVNYESAKEVELSIDATHKESESNRKKQTVRQKGDIDYAEQQKISQKIGDKGEELVLQKEIEKVTKLGLSAEVISKVRRVSLESDDYGFDILSFDEYGDERYLEVKTTKVNKQDFSFILTQNELEHAKKLGSKYCIVIVFDILGNPRIWYMGNPFIEEPYKVRIKPTQYRVDVSIQ